MAQEFNAFSVASKGYTCGLGTTGYYAFAIATKGFICDAEEPPAPPAGGDSGGPWRRKQTIDTSLATMLAREDEEALSIIIAISRKRRL